ncbi:MAG: tetratricopeptide repeat protein [Bacteroidia bacterium]|nr:tetratricopeptide repeat protein [Bacteroidia bacterium]
MAKKPEKKQTVVEHSWFNTERKTAALLALIAFVLYARTFGFGYALDDIAVVQANKYVQDGFGGFGKILSTFYWNGFESFSTQNSGIFRPVSLLLFATEWQIFGNSPGVFHFVNVLLYALCSFQLFLLLNSLFGKEKRALAFGVVLLWTVLPVHTEVAANIKSADEILALLFSVLSMRYLLRWNDTGKFSYVFFSAGYMFLAMLSKEGAALILPIAFIMMMLFRNHNIKSLLRPAMIFAAVSIVWLVWHQAVIMSAEGTRVEYDYRHNALLSNDSWIIQKATALGMQTLYWIKALVGYPLSYNYSFNQIPIDGFSGINFWIALVGLIASVYAVVKYFRTQPVLVFGICFYWISFAMTSNIFFSIGDIFAERFLFVPSVGFVLIIAWFINRFLNKENADNYTNSANKVIYVMCLIYAGLAFNRAGDWKDQETLFLADVEHAPQSARVHTNAGTIYLNAAVASKDEVERKELWNQAYTEYKSAADIDSTDFQAYQALGQICYHLGDYKASVMWSRKCIAARFKLSPEAAEDVITLSNLGDAYRKLEMYDSAVAVYSRALRIAPSSELSIKAGDMHLLRKDTAAALAVFENSVKQDSLHAASWDKLANLKGMRGDFAGSTDAFLHLSRLNPADLRPWQMIFTNAKMTGDSLMMKRATEEYIKRGGK